MLCGVLLLVTGLWPWLARAMTRIPKPIASAMLAGILLPICLAPVLASVGDTWWQGLTVVLVWLVLARLAPRWAVPAAVVATAIVVAIGTGGNPLAGQSIAPTLQFVAPSIDPAVLVSLGIPLYVVTMAGQNVPGFAVLRTFGYENLPARAILAASGAGTIVGGLFGAYTLNLSAITAAMMAGPDAHPDRSKRWITTVTSGSFYLVLGLGASAATALVSVSPPILITAIAGLALFGALGERRDDRARGARAPPRRDHHVPRRRVRGDDRRHRLGALGARRRRDRDALARAGDGRSARRDASRLSDQGGLADEGQAQHERLDGELSGQNGQAADDARAEEREGQVEEGTDAGQSRIATRPGDDDVRHGELLVDRPAHEGYVCVPSSTQRGRAVTTRPYVAGYSQCPPSRVGRPGLVEPAPLQQRRDHRVASAELAVRLERVLRAADPEQQPPESVAVLARQPAVLGEPLDGVGVEHLAPDVGVVARVVAAREDVGEVRARVPGRHGRVVESDGGEGGRLERGDVGDGRRGIRAQGVPGLIEQRGRQVLARREALVERLRLADARRRRPRRCGSPVSWCFA